ncbi:MAG: polysaccharide deacetylase family protein [candidate division Zixibacteria bacterium]
MAKALGTRALALIVWLLIISCGMLVNDSALAQSKAKSGKSSAKKLKEICITIDELPSTTSFEEPDIQALHYLILQSLKAHKVKACGFIISSRVGESWAQLGEWLNDGHTLGNMTFSAQDLHELGITKFIADVKAGHKAIEPMLSGFGQKHRYFRFPYLHYGMTSEAKRQLTMYLEQQSYRVVHATVVPEDYLYNLTLQKIGKYPDSAESENLLNEYVNHVLDQIERSEGLAMELEGRPIKQTLLLRMNRLNAIYLDEMLTAIENMGYRFISIDQAAKDKIYSRPEGYFGGRGVSWLDMLILSDPDRTPAQ